MKHLKAYKTFESIHPLNTNIKELDSDFVDDIIDICTDLDDEFPQTDRDSELVSFYSTYFRSSLKLGLEPFPEYPSISIHMPYHMYGYSFGEKDEYSVSKECNELKPTALRIKEFLGDAYIAFVIPNGHKKSIQVLNDDTRLSRGIHGFQIVYDPNKLTN